MTGRSAGVVEPESNSTIWPSSTSLRSQFRQVALDLVGLADAGKEVLAGILGPGQGAAVYALQQPGGGEFAGGRGGWCLKYGEMLDQVRRRDFAVAFEQQQDLLFAQGRQVDCLMGVMHVCALFCVFMRD